LSVEFGFLQRLKRYLLQFIFLRFLFLNVSDLRGLICETINNHFSLFGKFYFPELLEIDFTNRAIVLSKLDFYRSKFLYILDFFKGIKPNLLVDDQKTYAYTNYLIHVFHLKRQNMALNSKTFFYQLYLFYSRLEQISWGFYLMAFRDGLITRPIENSSVRSIFFSYRNTMRLWSISQIEKMYNAFNFLEKTARRRQNFSKIKRREYSFFLIASSSYLDNYFFQTFKHFTSLNFLMFVYLRTAEREKSCFFDSQYFIANSASITASSMDLVDSGENIGDIDIDEYNDLEDY